jgi:microcystin-dependent protein
MYVGSIPAAGFRGVEVQVYKNGSPLGTPQEVAATEVNQRVAFAFTTIDTPSAGTNTYTVRQTISSVAGRNYDFVRISLVELTGQVGPTGPAGTTGVDSPTGSVIAFAGASAPTNWLLCDGSAVSRTTYNTLFALIGTTYGAGNGSSTFNLPNLKSRIPVGVDDADSNFNVLGETGGATTHTHGPGTFAAAIGATASNATRIGYQAVNVVAGGATNSTYGISGTAQNNQSFNHYTPVYGVSADGSTLQPYIALNYIIKT